MDWSYVPSPKELENHFRIEALAGKGMLAVRGHVMSEKIKRIPQISFKPAIKLGVGDYIEHDTSDVDKIKAMYLESGFETDVILQDPIGHRGPTVACPIGFPSTLHKPYKELRRFNRWICRVHVDIGGPSKTLKLVSVPHIEPDPKFDLLDHIWYTFICNWVVRGPPAVEILKSLLAR